MSEKSLNELETACLASKLGVFNKSLSELKQMYYASQTGDFTQSVSSNIITFLKEQTGKHQINNVNELWRAYMIKEGITDSQSLGQMFREFWTACPLP